MSDNLALWQAVETTPPSHVKEITGKSYKGNSPKPHYLIHKATETFGPCGIGWGFEIMSERLEEGAGGEKIHIAQVRVWYKWNGERGEVEHVGGTVFSGTRSSGKPFSDEDAPKKSVTDALVKALSMIGFAGDIFMGRYDDSKYVSDLRREEEEAAAPPPDEKSIKAYIAAFRMALEKAETREDVVPLWKMNEFAREKLNIKPGSHIWTELRALWEARGKELAAQTMTHSDHTFDEAAE